jgi:predicted phosphate transport protein (TIGR00153 family)
MIFSRIHRKVTMNLLSLPSQEHKKLNMSLNPILQYFVPKDRKFYPLFEQAASNLLAISNVLIELMTAPTPEKRTGFVRQIEKLEHVGDEITHNIFQEVSTTFITPFDREDIQRLASVLDDVLDYIHGSAKRIELYKMDPIHPSMIKLAELIQQCAVELHSAISSLRGMKNLMKIRESLVRVNSIENHADDIFDNAVARLFEDEKDAIEIIKVKEILSALETATDKCEDVANVIESVIIKQA